MDSLFRFAGFSLHWTPPLIKFKSTFGASPSTPKRLLPISRPSNHRGLRSTFRTNSGLKIDAPLAASPDGIANHERKAKGEDAEHWYPDRKKNDQPSLIAGHGNRSCAC
jgi:hypothetical protein